MSILAKLTLIVFVVAASGVMTKVQAADSIVGTWRLVSAFEEETESKAVHKTLGDNPSGLLTYTSDGRVMTILTDSSRKPTAAPKPTDAEAAQLFVTMIAYAGRYTLEGEKITHHIDISWNEAWNGTDRWRYFEMKNNRLALKSPPFVSPFSNKEIVATAVWERAKWLPL
jgi:hypothetical protein